MKRIVIGLALIFALAGCGEQAAGGYSDDPGEESIIPGTTAYVKEINVNDTTCVIFRDGDMGGISCDWSNDEELD